MQLHEKEEFNDEKCIGNLIRKKQGKSCLLTLDFNPFRSQVTGKHSAHNEFHNLFAKKETVGLNILRTSRNGDRKIFQTIRIGSRPPTRKGSPTVFKRSSKCRINSPTYPFMQLVQHIQVATRSINPTMTTVFQVRSYGRFVERKSKVRRKKLHRINQGSNFPRGSFGSADNVRVSIQFRRRRQSQHLQRQFSIKIRPIYFYINSTTVIRPVSCNKQNFSSIEINLLLLQIRCLITQSKEQYPPR